MAAARVIKPPSKEGARLKQMPACLGIFLARLDLKRRLLMGRRGSVPGAGSGGRRPARGAPGREASPPPPRPAFVTTPRAAPSPFGDRRHLRHDIVRPSFRRGEA